MCEGLERVFIPSIVGSGMQAVLSPGEKILRRKIICGIAART